MEQILVTGGSGYLGSSLSLALLEDGYKVNVFDFMKPESEEFDRIIRHPNSRFYLGDIKNGIGLNVALEGCSSLIHLAAISDGIRGLSDPDLTMVTNYNATRMLADLAKQAGIKRFLFSSTFGVYGNDYTCPLTEGLAVDPIEPYSFTKVQCERHLAESNDDQFTTCSLRLATLYGVSVQNKFDFLVNNLTRIAVKTNKLSIYGGEQRRPQIHIMDVVNAFITLLKEPKDKIAGKIFNLASENPSLSEIVSIIKEFIPDLQVDSLPNRPQEYSYIVDGSKIERELNFKYQYYLRDGIKELSQFFKIERNS